LKLDDGVYGAEEHQAGNRVRILSSKDEDRVKFGDQTQSAVVGKTIGSTKRSRPSTEPASERPGDIPTDNITTSRALQRLGGPISGRITIDLE